MQRIGPSDGAGASPRARSRSEPRAPAIRVSALKWRALYSVTVATACARSEPGAEVRRVVLLPDVVRVGGEGETAAGERRGHPAHVRAVVGEVRVHMARVSGGCGGNHSGTAKLGQGPSPAPRAPSAATSRPAQRERADARGRPGWVPRQVYGWRRDSSRSGWRGSSSGGSRLSMITCSPAASSPSTSSMTNVSLSLGNRRET